MTELKISRIYRHDKKGTLYTLVNTNAKLQENGVWHDALLYLSHTLGDTTIYCRTHEEFKQKFSLIADGTELV